MYSLVEFAFQRNRLFIEVITIIVAHHRCRLESLYQGKNIFRPDCPAVFAFKLQTVN
jgi:hypothetical protein